MRFKKTNHKEFSKLVERYNPILIVVDSYDIDYKFEKELKTKYPKVKLMVLDDTYEKHYCDILLNHNISANKEKYQNLVPNNCELRCGVKYTLIRDEFYQVKKELKIKNKKSTIFLAMGGADSKNLMLDILQVLEDFDVEVNVVTTNANKNIDKLKQYTQAKQNIKLFINSSKIAKIMYGSDIAIISPSVIMNEIFFLGLDFIAIQTAENQRYMSEYLENNPV